MHVFLPLRTMETSPHEVRKTRKINDFIKGQNISRVKKKLTGKREDVAAGCHHRGCRIPETGDRSPPPPRKWSDENSAIRL